MKVIVIGAGIYGCHITEMLIGMDVDVELHEIKDEIFAGASGNNVGRGHLGFHYPRSESTRRMCQSDVAQFDEHYADFVKSIPVNIYAIAEYDSLIDFPTYKKILRDEVEFIEIDKPGDFGLQHVEGALLTGEKYLLISKLRAHFARILQPVIHYNSSPKTSEKDLVIDCTFCNLENADVQRFEPCVTHFFEGDNTKAVTIMDGNFGSFYPSMRENCMSLTSAKYTPLSRSVETYDEAKSMLDGLTKKDIADHLKDSLELMAHYYPAVMDYKHIGIGKAVRAMPRSGSDNRVYSLKEIRPNYYSVRSGKLDAVVKVAEDIKRIVEIRC